jgi:hypothetical protein
MEKSIADLEFQIEILTRRLEEAEARAKRAEARAEQNAMVPRLAQMAAAAGCLPSAIPDAVNRLMEAGTWKPGKNGAPVLHGEDGIPKLDATGDMVTLQRAVDSLKSEAAHLWPEDGQAIQQAPGAPQRPSQKPGTSPAYTGPNPWLKESRNLTLQSQIATENPALAEQLAKAAGRPVIPTGINSGNSVFRRG